MAFDTPVSRNPGYTVPSTEWNKNTVTNPLALYAGEMSFSGQATHQLVKATSATQLGGVTVPSRGAVLYAGASGAPSWLAAGTSGYVLTAAGAGADPAWAALSTFVVQRLTTSDTEATTTSSSYSSVKTLSSLNIATTSAALLMFMFRRGATAESASLKLLVNGTELLTDTAVVGAGDGNAHNGMAWVWLSPRTTNYPLVGIGRVGANQGGALDQAWPTSSTAHTLTGAITSIEIQAKNSGGTATVGVAQVKLFEMLGA